MNLESEQSNLKVNNAFTRKFDILLSRLIYAVLVGAPLFLLSILFLVLVTIYSAQPYNHVRDFTQTTCQVVKIEQTDAVSSCGAGSDFFIPCIKIYVTYITGIDDNKVIKKSTAVIMEDEQSLLNCNQCSYAFGQHSLLHSDEFDCKMWMENFNPSHCIERFLARHGNFNTTFSCYFNPNNNNEVILTRVLDATTIIHGYLWPLLFCFFYLLCLILVLYRNEQKNLRKKLLSRRTKERKKETMKKNLKEELNRCLGVRTPGRICSEEEPALYLSEDDLLKYHSNGLKKGSLPMAGDDMRHLDLAVTDRNIDELASSYLPVAQPTTLPRSSRRKTLWNPLPLLPTLKAASLFTFGFSNSVYDCRESLSRSSEAVSITTSNMLTEWDIDELYRTKARDKKPTRLSGSKSETAV